MKNINFRVLLSAICMASVLAGFTKISAGPVRFNDVVQIVNARPGKAEMGTFSRLRVAGDYTFLFSSDDDDDDKKKKDVPVQDDRVITETRTDIVADDFCDCEEDIKRGGFPKWALLGLAAIPIIFLLIHDDDDDTPTPTKTPTGTPTKTPTGSPTGTPTGSPTPSVTPTPKITPSPTPPEPVPEPMTILLFGTGLASIGLAARRKFGKKGDSQDENEEE